MRLRILVRVLCSYPSCAQAVNAMLPCTVNTRINSLFPLNGGRQTGGRQTGKNQKSQKSKIPKNLKNHPQNQKDTIKKIKANKYET